MFSGGAVKRMLLNNRQQALLAWGIAQGKISINDQREIALARVVSQNAIVIEADEFEALQLILQAAKTSNLYVVPSENYPVSKLLRKLAEQSTSPVQEPRGFGARVKADLNSLKNLEFMGDGHGHWIEMGKSFELTPVFGWKSLSNPVVLDEGFRIDA